MGDSNKVEFLNFIGDAIVNLECWGSRKGAPRRHELIRKVKELADKMLTYSTSLPPGKVGIACEKVARFLMIIRVKIMKAVLTERIKFHLRRASHFCAHILSEDLPVDYSSCPCCCKKCGKQGTKNHGAEASNVVEASNAKETSTTTETSNLTETSNAIEAINVVEASNAAEESNAVEKSNAIEASNVVETSNAAEESSAVEESSGAK
ncbi:hypothetical protein PEBR_37584 [Penicillium brasilianum]|uniref:Uncharacterized protein n=1 Tax=Penicillium brasilianum TaxID=104259 RepID=A0A1S9RB77_PENBI|nr:hypothetical protein PEBR_37584 [Penicillium brasilianum]